MWPFSKKEPLKDPEPPTKHYKVVYKIMVDGEIVEREDNLADHVFCDPITREVWFASGIDLFYMWINDYGKHCGTCFGYSNRAIYLGAKI